MTTMRKAMHMLANTNSVVSQALYDKMLMLLPNVISSRVFEISETSPNQKTICVIFLLKNKTVSLLPLLSLYCLTVRKNLQSNSSMDKIT